MLTVIVLTGLCGWCACLFLNHLYLAGKKLADAGRWEHSLFFLFGQMTPLGIVWNIITERSFDGYGRMLSAGWRDDERQRQNRKRRYAN